jgi:hypothetical protein
MQAVARAAHAKQGPSSILQRIEKYLGSSKRAGAIWVESVASED